MNQRRTMERVNVREYAPMQEIADSLNEMLLRIANLDYNSAKDIETYNVLLRRVKSQAFCMQSVSEDPKLASSSEYNRLISHYDKVVRDPNTKPLVRECLKNVLQILIDRPDISSHIQHKEVHPSGQMLTAFYRANNHIEERMNLAESNPENYRNSAQVPLHKEIPRDPRFYSNGGQQVSNIESNLHSDEYNNRGSRDPRTQVESTDVNMQNLIRRQEEIKSSQNDPSRHHHGSNLPKDSQGRYNQ